MCVVVSSSQLLLHTVDLFQVCCAQQEEASSQSWPARGGQQRERVVALLLVTHMLAQLCPALLHAPSLCLPAVCLLRHPLVSIFKANAAHSAEGSGKRC